MRKQVRRPEPEVLTTRKAKWTNSWVRKGAKAKLWFWPKVKGQRINLILVRDLMLQNQNHCSFCDQYPMDALSPKTIEHFVPKESNGDPTLAFEWTNLFYCCAMCQGLKRTQYDIRLLKPDEDHFLFLQFFMWDYITGELRPNPLASEEDRERAAETIRIYGMNAGSRPKARRDELNKWSRMTNPPPLDEWPYRDFLEGAE